MILEAIIARLKCLALLPGMVLLVHQSVAQKIFTKNGHISFFSSTPLEDIKADNNQVVSVLNSQTGELQFSLLIKNFRFKKALMEEHFNESYLESEKYPKAIFKGMRAGNTPVNFGADGTYPVTATGDLTIHGITKKISVPGTITIKAGQPAASARFQVKPADYNISIPKIVRNNIAEVIEVTVTCNYDQKT
jgi:hypothetical protein